MSHEQSDEAEALNVAFRANAAKFNLAFRCDACAHVHIGTSSCSLGYPNHYLTGDIIAVQPDLNMTFCKYFELGEQSPEPTP